LFCKWADDSQRLILENFDTIQDSPPKIYHEAIPFSPSSSWLHECYSQELLQEVKVVKGFQARWGTCSRTILLNNEPRTVACWNNLIVAGLESGNIVTLDATTGAYISTLSGHSDSVRSVAFSFDGTILVSGTFNGDVSLWDIQTGGIIRTFDHHTYGVSAVSISADQTTVATGSGDWKIRLFDTQTGECCCTIDTHRASVYSVSFSPTDSQLLLSASHDNTVRQWNINGLQIGPSYQGAYAAFSSDGTHFVSWLEGVAMVQKSDSGITIATLQAPVDHQFQSCCFSPNGRFVAGASSNNIYIWDITGLEPHLIETLVGHTKSITSIAFPSSLISSSYDGSIKFWQVDTSSTDQVSTDSESTIHTPASIVSMSLQAKYNIAISSDSAGVVRIWDISTGHCNGSFHTPAGQRTQRDAQLINGKLIFVWCTYMKIHIWDVEKEKHILQVDARSRPSTTSPRISGDGSKVFLLDQESIRAWSIWTGEMIGEVRLKGKPLFDSLTMDGSKVWVCFGGSKIQGWDFGVPDSVPILLSTILPDRPHLDFIHGTTTCPPRIKDTVTGKEVLQLSRRYERFTKMQWDGRYLVAGYTSGELLILDFNQVIHQ